MLVVVDVQPGFDAAFEVQDAVAAAVRRAVARRERVAVLEFDPEEWGDTLVEVMDPLSGYDRVVHAIKSRDGGAQDLFPLLDFHPAEEPWRFCGVNTCACVKATILGCANRGAVDIRLVRDAVSCNSDWRDPKICLRELRRMVRLLREGVEPQKAEARGDWGHYYCGWCSDEH